MEARDEAFRLTPFQMPYWKPLETKKVKGGEILVSGG